MKLMIVIATLSVNLNADIIHFYRHTLKTLSYDKTHSLYKQSNSISQEGVTQSRYANFSLDASYANTKAETLNNPFYRKDISLNDAIDIFGKKSYQVDALALELKTQNTLLDIQKEQLFNSLVQMIAAYYVTKEKYQLNEKLYSEQQKIYSKLEALETSGSISGLDLLRFKNTLTNLQTKLLSLKNEIQKMQNQLHLYAPHEKIPHLDVKLHYGENDFLTKNPQAKLNNIEADKLLIQAKTLHDNYLPEISVGMGYQANNDPTSYGDNYSVTLGMHMPLNSGDFHENEALRVNALSKKNRAIEYELQRKNEYIQRFQDYQSALEQFKVLNANVFEYQKSEKTIKIAFLKQYVNFDTYLQVLTQALGVKEQMIDLKSQADSQATILNAISSGVVYE
jgi:outer membrane protein TolC